MSLNYRDFWGFDSEKFKTDLKKENWDSIFTCDEVNESFTRFLHIYNIISNEYAARTTAKKKHKTYINLG